MRRQVMFAAALTLLLAAGRPVLAAGDGGAGSGNPDMVSCAKGEAWDPKTKKCVKAEKGILPDKTLTAYAYLLAKEGRYDEALAILDLLKNPNTAQALNYRGYATRKLGRVDEGIEYYLKSVALNPRYAQVREYLGEAYVVKGDIVRAKAQLRAIRRICGTSCEEYKDLAEAIADPSKV
jgi:tetratricopeptide (TPR) repeat protein